MIPRPHRHVRTPRADGSRRTFRSPLARANSKTSTWIWPMRSALKTVAHVVATIVISPALASFCVKRWVIGGDRALAGSTQALAMLPGLLGVYLRGAFLAVVLAHFDRSASVHFGTIFSQTGARIGANVYVGPHCHLGLVDIDRDVLLAS